MGMDLNWVQEKIYRLFWTCHSCEGLMWILLTKQFFLWGAKQELFFWFCWWGSSGASLLWSKCLWKRSIIQSGEVWSNRNVDLPWLFTYLGWSEGDSTSSHKKCPKKSFPESSVSTGGKKWTAILSSISLFSSNCKTCYFVANKTILFCTHVCIAHGKYQCVISNYKKKLFWLNFGEGNFLRLFLWEVDRGGHGSEC